METKSGGDTAVDGSSGFAGQFGGLYLPPYLEYGVIFSLVELLCFYFSG